MRGTRGQLTRRGLVVAVAVVLVGGAVFGGAVFGFGLGGSGDTGPGTPTVAPGTPVTSSTIVPTPPPTATITVRPTPTATASPTVTATPSPTRTATQTASPIPQWKAYEPFINTVLGELAEESQVPVRIRGLAVREETLWLFVNATDPAVNDTRRTKEWGALVTGYARAYYFHHESDISGQRTDGMRVLEVNNTGESPQTFELNNSVARRVNYGGLGGPELVGTYYSTFRNQTNQERTITRENDILDSNWTYGPGGDIHQTNNR
jgi:hypothetical protein